MALFAADEGRAARVVLGFRGPGGLRCRGLVCSGRGDDVEGVADGRGVEVEAETVEVAGDSEGKTTAGMGGKLGESTYRGQRFASSDVSSTSITSLYEWRVDWLEQNMQAGVNERTPVPPRQSDTFSLPSRVSPLSLHHSW